MRQESPTEEGSPRGLWTRIVRLSQNGIMTGTGIELLLFNIRCKIADDMLSQYQSKERFDYRPAISCLV
jgi:hypothetical protein